MLGESLDTHGVTAAGGMLIQVMPKAARDEALVEALESRITALSGFTPLLQEGKPSLTFLSNCWGTWI